MALKVELKPFERIVIGGSLITNSETRTRFMIEGEAPILREKDILTAEMANTPVKRLYLCTQMMYLENDIPKYQDIYMGFVKDLLEAVPSFRPSIETASKLILSGSIYGSLKEIRNLIKREEELLQTRGREERTTVLEAESSGLADLDRCVGQLRRVE